MMFRVLNGSKAEKLEVFVRALLAKYGWEIIEEWVSLSNTRYAIARFKKADGKFSMIKIRVSNHPPALRSWSDGLAQISVENKAGLGVLSKTLDIRRRP